MRAPLLSWAKRNERHLSSAFFLAGFVGDLIAFTLLEVEIVALLFAVYLAGAVIATIASHYLFSRYQGAGSRVTRFLVILLPLSVQYAVGAILSGSLIFYTKSATVFVSWPFLLLLAAVFLGNEIFRTYREHLAFQTTLLFFGAYAYAIFALPLLLHRLGSDVFLISSALATGGFALFLWALYQAGKARFLKSFRFITFGSTALLALIMAAYFTGLVPPLPLSLKEAGVYHSVSRTSDGYVLTTEGEPLWWEALTVPTLHLAPGASAYAYSAVFAPVRFSSGVVHVWERKDPDTGRWMTVARVPFAVSGGRAQGYRGYSEKTSPQAGRWRLTIQTGSGQTIGRRTFNIEIVAVPPALTTVTK